MTTSTLAGSMGGSSRSPRRNSRFLILFLRALVAPKATIFSELSTAMTFLARRASNSLNNPSPAPKIGNDQRRQHAQKQLPKGLPGAARAVTAIKAAGHLVKIKLRLLRAPQQNSLQIDLVGAMLRQFLGAAHRQLDEFARRWLGVAPRFCKTSACLRGAIPAGRLPATSPGGSKCAIGPCA